MMEGVSEGDVIRNLSRAAGSAQCGQQWCVVAARWLSSWQQFAEGMGGRPEAVDNAPLLDERGQMRRGLLELQDYVLLPKQSYDKLAEWYGGGPALVRPVIEVGLRRRPVVEVYPMTLRVAERRNPAREETVVEASKAALGMDLLAKVCQHMQLPPRRCVLWKLGTDGYEQLALNATLSKSGLDEGMSLIVEESLPDGSFEQSAPPWQRPKGQADFGLLSAVANGRSVERAFLPRAVVDSDQRAPEVGVTGLVNLGNTCFMNSSLQCVAACAPLRSLLLSERLDGLINKTNPLGMGGRVAKTSADLFRRMWAEDNVRFVVPRAIKEVIADFAPQFEGYRQHDSQEFVAFLLDGLHEDLNQVKQKQLVAVENAVGLADDVAAAQAWDKHLLRNKSEIVNLFHGQMRSKLVCPSCQHVSITFDPFSFLSLPLPRSDSRQLQITFVPMTLSTFPGTVEQMSVSVNRASTVVSLCDAVAARTGAKSELLVVAEVYQRSIYKEHFASSDVASIGPTDDIFVFEVEHRNDATVSKKSKDGQTIWKLGSCITFSLIFRKQPDLSVIGSPLVFSIALENLTVESIKKKIVYLVALHFSKGTQISSICFSTKSGKSCAFCGDTLCKGCEMTSEMLDKKTKVNKIRFLNSRMVIACNVDGGEFVTTRRVAEKIADVDSKKILTLDNCLKRLLEAEVLNESDAWFCGGCKKHVQAEKQIGLWRLPPVLVIHLKRFAFLSNRYREKLEDLVQFPLHAFDMRPYLLPGAAAGRSTMYDLFAVSNHMGGLGGGHYTAYAKPSEKWWLFNDESVSPVDDPQRVVVSPNAYILYFCQRK